METTELLGARIPGRFFFQEAELTPAGLVQLGGEILRSDRESSGKEVNYAYNHHERLLRVTPHSGGPETDFQFGGSWYVSDPAGEFKSPWILDWNARLGLKMSWRCMPLVAAFDEFRGSLVAFHQFGPLTLTKHGDVIIGASYTFPRGTRIDELPYEDTLSVRRITFRQSTRSYSLLEALDHHMGENLFYSFDDFGSNGYAWCQYQIECSYTPRKKRRWFW